MVILKTAHWKMLSVILLTFSYIITKLQFNNKIRNPTEYKEKKYSGIKVNDLPAN